MCHSVQVFLHARLIYDSMQCVTGAQPNDQSARRWNAHKHIFFASKMFVTPKSITNRPCRVLYTVIPMSVNYKKRVTTPAGWPAQQVIRAQGKSVVFCCRGKHTEITPVTDGLLLPCACACTCGGRCS